MILGGKLTTLDAINRQRLMMTSGHGLRGLNDINSSRLLITLTTLCQVLRAPHTMNSSSLWMIYATLGCELNGMNALNNSILWMI